MSKRTVYDCDRCGFKDIEAITFGIEVDKRMCPSGNGSEIDTAMINICPTCAAKVLNNTLCFSTFEAGRKFVAANFPFRKP